MKHSKVLEQGIHIRNYWMKGIIDGLACIKQGRIHWTHIGDGTELEKMKAYVAEKLEEKDNICYTFKGHMEYSQVLQYYET